jgi:hypothetical protein
VLLQPCFTLSSKIILLVTGFHVAHYGDSKIIHQAALSEGRAVGDVGAGCHTLTLVYSPLISLTTFSKSGTHPAEQTMLPAFLMPRFLFRKEAREKNFLAHSANKILLHFGPFSKPKSIVKSPKNQAFTSNAKSDERRDPDASPRGNLRSFKPA